jgi:hypothetical protein
MALLRHTRLVAAGALAAAGLTAFVLLYFAPQKLFINDVVHEPPPTVTTPLNASAPNGHHGTPGARVPASRTLTSGRFRSYEHATRGVARVIELADGRRYVRFEHFRTSNGPLLKVYMSAAPASGPSESFDDTFIDLGNLKGNIGEQNYEITRDVDLPRFHSVVIWCKRFSVAFAAAPL